MNPTPADHSLTLCALEAAVHALLKGMPAPPELLPETLDQLYAYLALLEKWNRVMNLVGTRIWQDTLRLLVADSFYLAPFLDALELADDVRAWDLGAGAGLPGVPLRMLWTRGTYTLVEAREKRALFLQTVLAACSLPRTDVFRGRAEAFMARNRAAGLVVSRAFLPWEQVLSLVEPSLEPRGVAVFLTRTPAPEALPPGWALRLQSVYRVGDAARFFWALEWNR